MPVKGAGGESGTATHRLANRARRRAGERRAPGSRSQNTGTQGQAGGSMAVRGPGRRIDASNTPFNRMRHSAAREKQRTAVGRWCRREASQGSTQARREYPPRHRSWQERPDRRGSPSAGCRQARRRGGRAGGGGDKRAQARGRAAQRGAHANQRGRAARRRAGWEGRWRRGCRGGSKNAKNGNLLKVTLVDKVQKTLVPMSRPYHPERTGSHQNSEVKLYWAGLVLC